MLHDHSLVMTASLHCKSIHRDKVIHGLMSWKKAYWFHPATRNMSQLFIKLRLLSIVMKIF